jgi:hydroxymethylpyrimidine/phosphomethylpyrimidine kinase
LFPVAPPFVAQQIDTLFADVAIAAVKIGMLGQAGVITTVADRLAHWQAARIVLDPVMVAKSGDALLEKSAVGALREALLPLAMVITPNLPEAGVLLEGRAPETRRARRAVRAAMARRRALGAAEGQALASSDAVDLLHDGDRMIELTGRASTPGTRTAPAALSSALAALLPRRRRAGRPPRESG